jgi:sulfatase modifying factor 1
MTKLILIAALALLGACASTAGSPRTFSDCADCPQMLVIPGGTFLMGSPQDEAGRSEDRRNGDEDDTPGPGGAQVRVTVPRFAIGVYEITHKQFADFVAATNYDTGGGCIVDLHQRGEFKAEPEGSWRNFGRPVQDNLPVICVDWNDANAYAHWLSERTGHRYRLPSESEFEYARRAGTTTPYFFGDNLEDICKYANVPDASLHALVPGRPATQCNDGNIVTAPVGQYLPNAFGIYDITGNVWEWLQDCYRDSYAETPRDGTPFMPATCEARSIRGGSWGYDLPSLRSADRSDDPPDLLFDGISFRLVRELERGE